MPNLLLHALLDVGAPTAPAIETPDQTYTYGDLERESGRFAAAYAALGVAPGDRIVAQIEKSALGFIAYLAAIRAGAVWVPLNPGYTDAELAFLLADAQPRFVLTEPHRRASAAGLTTARVESLDRAGEGSFADIAARGKDGGDVVARQAGDPAAICYTSGTTGQPKGAILSHRALLSNAATLKDLWGFSAADVLIHALPLNHVHGLFVAMHTPMLAGARVILQERFEPAAVLQAMPRATVLMGVPTFYTRLLGEADLEVAASAMRLFVSGSAPLLAATHKAWRARTGQAILERYGLTETGMNTSNPLAADRRPGSVGLPLPGVRVRIADETTGAPAPAGAVGMIEVTGPNLFSGYWRNDAATAQAFRQDGFFVTGDLGVLAEDGYLTIVGRAKDLVISGGLNIYPKEVEDAIDAIDGVAESAVIGLPHADLGEAATAIVVREAGSDLSEAAILAALQGGLARFKQPRRVLFAPELPRNAMGKVQKVRLRKRYVGLYDAHSGR